MRHSLLLAAIVFSFASATTVPAPAQAQAQDKSAKGAAARPAAGKSAVPADVRAKVVANLPGAKPEDVAASPVGGLYEVTMGGHIVYVTSDGKFLLSGNIYDLDTQTNLTAARRSAARAKALAAVPEDQMIVFGPKKPKMTVTVFTDIDCTYCRRFHNQMADINKAGVRVRYMMYPRTGPGTESWRKAETVWCAKDRRDALTRAKKGEQLKSKECAADEALKAQWELGDDLGVEGTPAIFTQTGDYVGGFMTPDQLVQVIQETQKAAAAAN